MMPPRAISWEGARTSLAVKNHFYVTEMNARAEGLIVALIVAERGRGATVNGRPLAVSPRRRSARASSRPASPTTYARRPTTTSGSTPRSPCGPAGVRRMGSAVLYLAWLAAGRLDGYWELRLGPWDAAAGSLLIEEAGGRVTNLTGGALDLDAPALVASNGKIHAAMRTALEEIRG